MVYKNKPTAKYNTNVYLRMRLQAYMKCSETRLETPGYRQAERGGVGKEGKWG